MVKKVSFVRRISKRTEDYLCITIPKHLAGIFEYGDVVQVTLKLLQRSEEEKAPQKRFVRKKK